MAPNVRLSAPAAIGLLRKRAYGMDYVPQGTEDVLGLLERADVDPKEQSLEKFRDHTLREYPTATQLRLHYDRYDSRRGVDLLRQRNMSKVLRALMAARATSDYSDDYGDEGPVPFFDLQYKATTPEDRELLKAVRAEEAEMRKKRFKPQ